MGDKPRPKSRSFIPPEVDESRSVSPRDESVGWNHWVQQLWAPWLPPNSRRPMETASSQKLQSPGGRAPQRAARLWRPPTVSLGSPLLVMLHGCMQDAQSFAQLTRMDEFASGQGFFVLYPDQESSANPMQCWNWNATENQSREGGEPEALAHLIKQAQAICHTDASKTRMAGLSAGGALAATMAYLYPEYFGSVVVVAGPAPFAARNLREALDTMEYGPNAEADQRTKDHAIQTGEYSSTTQRLPILIVQGQADVTVNPKHGSAQERAALSLNAALSARKARRRKPLVMMEKTCSQGSVRTWLDGGGQVIVVVIEPKNLGHAWSGGTSSEAFAQKGFDQSQVALDFFKAAESGHWSLFIPEVLCQYLWGSCL